MKNILIVCLGNICRSPMAEGYYKYQLGKARKKVLVSSAGIDAVVGESAVREAAKVMRAAGIDISKHMARQITPEMIMEADLVLVMEKIQKKKLEFIFPTAYGKIHLLGKWSDFEVPDPFCKPTEDFEECLHLIEKSWQDWQKRIS